MIYSSGGLVGGNDWKVKPVLYSCNILAPIWYGVKYERGFYYINNSNIIRYTGWFIICSWNSNSLSSWSAVFAGVEIVVATVGGEVLINSSNLNNGSYPVPSLLKLVLNNLSLCL